jgi:hypothetical protein
MNYLKVYIKEILMTLQEMIDQHGGIVARGEHEDVYNEPHCPLCILEMHAACLVSEGKLMYITDEPEELGRPDYRPINDAHWSSREVATPHLVRLHLAYEGWDKWKNKEAITKYIIVETTKRILSKLYSLPRYMREACIKVTTIEEVEAITDEIPENYNCSASNSMYAAAAQCYIDEAATAMSYVDDDTLLIEVVNIWVEAANKFKDVRYPGAYNE